MIIYLNMLILLKILILNNDPYTDIEITDKYIT